MISTCAVDCAPSDAAVGFESARLIVSVVSSSASEVMNTSNVCEATVGLNHGNLPHLGTLRCMPDNLHGVSLKVAGYKCFGDEPQGFEHLPAFTLIIGRNNTGKSALLDLLKYIVAENPTKPLTLGSTRATVTITAPITQTELQHVPGQFHHLAGESVRWSILEHVRMLVRDFVPSRIAPTNLGGRGKSYRRLQGTPVSQLSLSQT